MFKPSAPIVATAAVQRNESSTPNLSTMKTQKTKKHNIILN